VAPCGECCDTISRDNFNMAQHYFECFTAIGFTVTAVYTAAFIRRFCVLADLVDLVVKYIQAHISLLLAIMCGAGCARRSLFLFNLLFWVS